APPYSPRRGSSLCSRSISGSLEFAIVITTPFLGEAIRKAMWSKVRELRQPAAKGEGPSEPGGWRGFRSDRQLFPAGSARSRSVQRFAGMGGGAGVNCCHPAK